MACTIPKNLHIDVSIFYHTNNNRTHTNNQTNCQRRTYTSKESKEALRQRKRTNKHKKASCYAPSTYRYNNSPDKHTRWRLQTQDRNPMAWCSGKRRFVLGRAEQKVPGTLPLVLGRTNYQHRGMRTTQCGEETNNVLNHKKICKVFCKT